jgi:hypothetical protein
MTVLINSKYEIYLLRLAFQKKLKKDASKKSTQK